MASLAALLVVLTGCEPDECDLQLNYSVSNAGVHDVAWSSPSATCSVSAGDTTFITIERGSTDLELSFTAVPKVGNVPVNLRYLDEQGTRWSGTCSLVASEAEFVEWVIEDHWRVSGTITCQSPLFEEFDFDIDRRLTLVFGEISVYAGAY